MNVTDFEANFDFDAKRQRLMVWGRIASDPGTSNFEHALYFVDAAGGHFKSNLPDSQAPTAIACNGRGRTYVSISGSLRYFDGMVSNPTLVPLLSPAGGPYSLPVNVTDLLYDESLNALVVAYISGVVPGSQSAAIRVIPLDAAGASVVPGETTHLWLGGVVGDLASDGLGRGRNGELYLGVLRGQTELKIHELLVDPVTLQIGSAQIACFSQSYHGIGTFTWAWRQAVPLFVGSYAAAPAWIPSLIGPAPECSQQHSVTELTDCMAPGALGAKVGVQTIPYTKLVRR
jgi:hypothetical protein